MQRYVFFVGSLIAAAAFVGCGRTEDGSAPQGAQPSATSAETRQPHANYSVQWLSNDAPQTMKTEQAVTVNVSAKNTGDWAWPDPITANPSQPNGRYAVRLSYRWVDDAGGALPVGSARGELTRSVPPGQTADFKISVVAPGEAGHYQLQFDLVEELVTFFSARGAEKLSVPVSVEATP
jgi:hypothetical protein